ncbi:DUF2147 domain-containing protein [Spirosoma spitsbergense]|uniref:DUF2147 domain-containing protein n=1 Tax=Spirosoma spitsbergense TaxID=431554 RepID=UPI00035FDDA3|nr:DUF2147 domain-containing protein [Spirosoma spitsbergense]
MKLFIYRSLLWAVLLPMFMLGATADQPADQLLGHWLFPTKGSSVTIYRIENRYFARVNEVDQAGEENFGLVKDATLIRNLTYNGEVWTGGELIHPKTGINLSVEVTMNDPQTVTVLVYKGIKLFHRKFTMTRKPG